MFKKLFIVLMIIELLSCTNCYAYQSNNQDEAPMVETIKPNQETEDEVMPLRMKTYGGWISCQPEDILLVRKWCDYYGIPEYYNEVIAIMCRESNFRNVTHTNDNGTVDYGKMQVNSSNRSKVKNEFGYSLDDLLDPDKGIQVGVWHFSQCVKNPANGTLTAMLREYNSGKAGNNKENKYCSRIYETLNSITIETSE